MNQAEFDSLYGRRSQQQLSSVGPQASTSSTLPEAEAKIPGTSTKKASGGIGSFLLGKTVRKASKNGGSNLCSTSCFASTLVNLMPILRWLPRYSLRNDLPADVITGLTVGVMVVPQGMAYATLAGLSPIYGLYAYFFAAFTYMFFGTSHHISIGTFAVGSMMVGAVKSDYFADYGTDHQHQPVAGGGGLGLEKGGVLIVENQTTQQLLHNGVAADPSAEQPDFTALELTSSLTLAVGLWQLAMAACRLSSLTNYISDPLVSGFTTGAALHVLTSQLDKALGVQLGGRRRPSGPGMLPRMWARLVGALPTANPYTVGITIAGMLFLSAGRDYVNPWVRRRCRVPLPMELFLVAASIVASTKMGLTEEPYHVRVVAHVPEGMPLPSWPRLDLTLQLLPAALSISVICYIFVLSMEKIFAKKHHYRLDANQELFALGSSQILSSLFPVYPSGASLARSSLCEMTGAKTPLHAFFSCALLFAVITWMGSWLEPLPMAVLACIVIVSLKNLFLQPVHELPRLWRVSRIDAAVWVVSCLGTICLDVTSGLLIGLLAVVLSSVLREQWAPFRELIPTPDGQHFCGAATTSGGGDGKDYFSSAFSNKDDSFFSQQKQSAAAPIAAQMRSVRIFRFESPIHFANAARFIDACAEINAELAKGVASSQQGRRPSICNTFASVARAEVASSSIDEELHQLAISDNGERCDNNVAESSTNSVGNSPNSTTIDATTAVATTTMDDKAYYDLEMGQLGGRKPNKAETAHQLASSEIATNNRAVKNQDGEEEESKAAEAAEKCRIEEEEVGEGSEEVKGRGSVFPPPALHANASISSRSSPKSGGLVRITSPENESYLTPLLLNTDQDPHNNTTTTAPSSNAQHKELSTLLLTTTGTQSPEKGEWRQKHEGLVENGYYPAAPAVHIPSTNRYPHQQPPLLLTTTMDSTATTATKTGSPHSQATVTTTTTTTASPPQHSKCAGLVVDVAVVARKMNTNTTGSGGGGGGLSSLKKRISQKKKDGKIPGRRVSLAPQLPPSARSLQQQPPTTTTTAATPKGHLVLDCSAIAYVDSMGVDALWEVHADGRRVGVVVAFAAANDTVLATLERSGRFFAEEEEEEEEGGEYDKESGGAEKKEKKAKRWPMGGGGGVSKAEHCYPTVHDAMRCICSVAQAGWGE